MWKSRLELAVASLALVLVHQQTQASGIFMPSRWLENGGIAADRSPEFYWALELKRLAKDFTPTEKRVPLVIPKIDYAKDPNATEPDPGDLYTKQREEADVREFDEAIQKGLIKPTDVALAKALNKGEGDDKTPEFPSEFADYHRGADAFTTPDTDSKASCEAWEGLLKRPKEERHYRSVWAAFMLGKAALYQKKPEAVRWFQMTRELAKEGFADSLGLAADSYGWEAKSELEQGHFETAAKLYLTQLALGDESAIVSLKALIPDRESIDGMMNFGEPPPENATEEQLKKWDADQAPRMQKALAEAARGPYLRKLVTAHILATETVASGLYEMPENGGAEPKERCHRWLTTLEKTGIKEVDDADHLGWVAYTAGRYDEASRWLKMVKADTATSLWLDAKLKRRNGKVAEAAPVMAKALALVRASTEKPGEVDEDSYAYFTPGLQPDQSAAGDLAALHVTRGDFVNAFAAFLEGRLWEDAAFVGDRVLTVDELKKYVDEHFPSTAEKPKKDDLIEPLDQNTKIRWMLARRLVREDRYEDARPYFPANMIPILNAYVAALNEAANEKSPKAKRARAWFTAAYIARYDGMELMGTEVEPDGFVSEGNFDPGSLDLERSEGAKTVLEFDEKKNAEVTVKKPVKLYVPSTAEEKKRIAASKPGHNKRFHYRYIASVLTTKAAALLPDGSEELADVIQSGSSWIRKGDEKGADKLIETLFKRCGSTQIAKGLKSKQPVVGPWTKEEAAARKIRNGIKDENP